MSIERKRMSATEREQMMNLAVASEIIGTTAERLGTRAGMVPRGKTRLGLAGWAINSLFADIMETMPTEQLVTFQRNMKMTSFVIGVRSPGGARRNEKEYGVWISYEAWKALLVCVGEYCQMCGLDRAERRACPLKKALDSIPNDVPDREDGDCPYYGVV